jgi:hypothetical protein
MRNEILGCLGIWQHWSLDVLDLSATTGPIMSCSTIIDMNMSSHGFADYVAHHGGTLVRGTKLSIIELHEGVISTINCPLRFEHRSMASFMQWLRMTYRKREISSIWTNHHWYRVGEYSSTRSSRNC